MTIQFKIKNFQKDLDFNMESRFSNEKKESLLLIVHYMFSRDDRIQSKEANFLSLFISHLGLQEAAVEYGDPIKYIDELIRKDAIEDVPTTEKFAEIYTGLDEKFSVYKACYQAAVSVSRRQTPVTQFLHQLRKSFNLEKTICLKISSTIAESLGISFYRTNQLSEEEKKSTMAFAFEVMTYKGDKIVPEEAKAYTKLGNKLDINIKTLGSLLKPLTSEDLDKLQNLDTKEIANLPLEDIYGLGHFGYLIPRISVENWGTVLLLLIEMALADDEISTEESEFLSILIQKGKITEKELLQIFLFVELNSCVRITMSKTITFKNIEILT